MAKLELEDMITGKKSKYSLVMAVAKRARFLSQKAEENGFILDEKPVKMAIRDFQEAKCEIYEPDDEEN